MSSLPRARTRMQLPSYEEWRVARDVINDYAEEYRADVLEGLAAQSEVSFAHAAAAYLQPLLWGEEWYENGGRRVGAVQGQYCAVVCGYKNDKPLVKYGNASVVTSRFFEMLRRFPGSRTKKDFCGYFSDCSDLAMTLNWASLRDQYDEQSFYKLGDKKRKKKGGEEDGEKGEELNVSSLDGIRDKSETFDIEDKNAEQPFAEASRDNENQLSAFIAEFFNIVGNNPAKQLLGTRRITRLIIESSDNISTFRRGRLLKRPDAPLPLHYHVDNLDSVKRCLEDGGGVSAGDTQEPCKKGKVRDCDQCRVEHEKVTECSDYCVVEQELLEYAAKETPRYIPRVAYWVFTRNSFPSCKDLQEYGLRENILAGMTKLDDRLIDSVFESAKRKTFERLQREA